MEKKSPKTLAEHRGYLHAIIRLKLHFLHRWLAEHPDEEFVSGLRNRVDIYRKADANPGKLNPTTINWVAPAWKAMESAALSAYRECGDDRDAFENAAFEVFRPSVDTCAKRDWTDTSGLNGYQCGSLRYETELRPEKVVFFHIANAVAPASIFEDPRYMASCFMVMLEQVEKRLGAERIKTSTWLNSHPGWLSYFPDEWQKNLTPPEEDVKWHYGFWGQFITARGTFNEKYGRFVRETGKLKYYPRELECSISAMREFLVERFFKE